MSRVKTSRVKTSRVKTSRVKTRVKYKNKILDILDKLPERKYKNVISKCLVEYEKTQENCANLPTGTDEIAEKDFRKLSRKNMLKYILRHNTDTAEFNKYFYNALEKQSRHFGRSRKKSKSRHNMSMHLYHYNF